jgi:hypothetical protein
MPDNCVVYQGEEADRRLAELGLEREDFIPVLEDAHNEAVRYRSVDDAKNAEGLVRWIRTVGLIRRRLSRKGWTHEDPQNLPITVVPSQEHIVITTTGDQETGNPLKTPTTQYPKGKATRNAIGDDPGEDESPQLSLMDLMEDELGEEMSEVVVDQSQHRAVWMLMYHFDKARKQVRAELSRPASMNAGEKIVRWQERIMLDSITVDETGTS